MNRLDISLSGYPGSGKSTIGEYMEDKWGFTQVTGSEVLQLHARKMGRLLVLRENYHDFYVEMRKKHGNDFIAQVGLGVNQERVAHIGIRTIADISRLIKASAVPIAVACDRSIRFSRTAGTSDKYPTDPVKFAQTDLLEDSFDEFGPQVGRVMDEARHTIDNNGSYQELYEQIDDIMDLYL